eukprot:7014787-Prymnesium_polylepis.1
MSSRLSSLIPSRIDRFTRRVACGKVNEKSSRVDHLLITLATHAHEHSSSGPSCLNPYKPVMYHSTLARHAIS